MLDVITNSVKPIEDLFETTEVTMRRTVYARQLFSIYIRRSCSSRLDSKEAFRITPPPTQNARDNPVALTMLVDRPSQLNSLVAHLRNQNTIAFDSEGLQLGSNHGVLSVISFHTAEGATYLVDVLAFTPSQLQSLFAVLADDGVTKLVWDGRMDASELLHGHGVQLRGGLDLQVADVAAERRRQGIYNSGCRQTTTIHRLTGLRAAAQEYGVTQRPGARGGYGGRVDHSQWLQRPLTAEQIRYATEDVEQIFGIYRIMCARSDIDEGELRLQSTAYHAFHRNGRPEKDDPYQRHSMMPLDILDLPDAHAPRTPCVGCRRALSQRCFPMASRGGRCIVCAMVAQERGLMFDREDEPEEGLDFDEYPDSDGDILSFEEFDPNF